MHTSTLKKLQGTSRRARGAMRLGLMTGLAALTGLLMMAPVHLVMADQAAPAPAKTSAPAAPPAAAPPAAAPPAAAPPAAAPPAAQQGPYTPPDDYVVKRIEIFGNVLSNIKGGTWKAPKIKSMTFQSLVVTTSDPLPVGKKGILFRKVETAGDPSSITWVKVADVTLKKVDATNKMLLDIDAEEKDVLINGKKSDHFAKGVKVKVQIDVPVSPAP